MPHHLNKIVGEAFICKQNHRNMDKIKTKLKFIKSDRTESWVGFVSINTKTGYIKGVREDAKGPKKYVL